MATQKKTLIKRIKAIIANPNVGQVTSAEMELDSSPSYSSLASVCSLVEECGLHKVTVITYDRDGNEVGEDYISYEELSKDLLEEILQNLENYEISQNKLMESCRD